MGWEPLTNLKGYGETYIDPLTSKERVGNTIYDKKSITKPTTGKLTYAEVTRGGSGSSMDPSQRQRNITSNSMIYQSH
jgi:hypothetical protein